MMKNFSICFFALLFWGVISFGQSNISEKSIKSEVLGKEIKFSVLLPKGYDPAKTYPIIFNLHGFGGSNRSADGFFKQLDGMMTGGGFPEVIVIAPDAANSWYIDDYAGKCKYSTMFVSEFLPAVENMYSISKVKEKRAIMGISMGGFGALRFSMLHPEQFGVCVSLMGAIMTREQARDDQYYDMFHKGLYGDNLKGADRMNDYFVACNPLYIIEKQDVKAMSGVKWFIQCCDQDFHSLPNAKLHVAMRERNIPHQYRVGAGDHDGKCSSSALPEALAFIKAAFEK